MPKVRFNPKPFRRVLAEANGNVRGPAGQCAFQPVMVDGVGVEAIIEGLRLANVEGFGVKLPGIAERRGRASDIDPGD